MFKEYKWFKENRSFDGIELSDSFLIELLKWAKVKNYIYDESLIKDKINCFYDCMINKNLFDYPNELRTKICKQIGEKYNYDIKDIVEMISSVETSFENRHPYIIAIEGIDGSGKTEQTVMLKNRLENKGKKVKVVSFPDYDSFFGKEIGYLLSGKGKIDANSVDTKSMSLWYALDRKTKLDKINLNEYDYIIFNRYTLSSAVYQSVRSGHRMEEWIFELENLQLGLPNPDLYLIMDVNVNQSSDNVLKKGERDYLEEDKDVYEKSETLLGNARKKYMEIKEKYLNMEIIACSDEENNLKSIEEISLLISNVLEQRNII